MNIKKIKEAVTANRGGLEEASDNQIRKIWNSLDKATQEKYLKTVNQGKEKTNAVSTGTRPKVSYSSGK